MDNRQVAGVLEQIARLLELQDENPFKVRAYRSAAGTLEGLSTDVTVLVRDGKLGEVKGIGEALEQKIGELVTTGRLKYLEDLKAQVPDGVEKLLEIPSLGPKKVRALWKELGIESLDGLRKACEENRLSGLKGFGEKSQSKILEGIAFVCRHAGQFLLSDAWPRARSLLKHLREGGSVIRAEVAGSLRRWKEVVRDVDLLASSDRPAEVMKRFVAAPGVQEVIGQGETKTSVRLQNGLQVDLRVVTDAEFAAALVYFTGSKEHNVALRQLALKKGLSLNEYGFTGSSIKVELREESDLYRALGLPWIPPELRENSGELNAKKTPQLIEYKHLKGVFHTHSTWSDGTASIEAMAEKARSLGFQYMGLSDHSKAAAYANGLDEARLRKQMEEVARLNRGWKDFRILHGLEADILPDGTIDLDPKVLAELDFVIGSIHSRFDMPESEMTDRVCKALASDELDFLGHPTGRLLLSREGFKLDLDRVLETAQRYGKVVELNAYPNRLDLDAAHARRAKEAGVRLSINPDAHSIEDLENVEYGVGTARRAWLEPKDVLNTRSLDEVLQVLEG
jgi:DNA polymerase (family 10)